MLEWLVFYWQSKYLSTHPDSELFDTVSCYVTLNLPCLTSSCLIFPKLLATVYHHTWPSLTVLFMSMVQVPLWASWVTLDRSSHPCLNGTWEDDIHRSFKLPLPPNSFLVFV